MKTLILTLALVLSAATANAKLIDQQASDKALDNMNRIVPQVVKAAHIYPTRITEAVKVDEKLILAITDIGLYGISPEHKQAFTIHQRCSGKELSWVRNWFQVVDAKLGDCAQFKNLRGTNNPQFYAFEDGAKTYAVNIKTGEVLLLPKKTVNPIEEALTK